MNYWELLNDAVKATRLGRHILLEYFGKLKNVQDKFQAGLVSEADQESEKTIKEFLLKRHPDSFFLGEESFFKNSQDYGSMSGKWICDPLDGTTNYIHQFPIFCISLAYELNNELVVGVIDVPILNETYTAIKGQGSWVNGQPLKVNSNTDFSKSLLATGFFPDDKPALQEQLKHFGQIVGDCRGVRRAGAAAYDLCQVARGVFDGFWEKNLSPWDVAAGQLIVEEAGGICRDYDNKIHTPYSKSIVAGTKSTVTEIIYRIQKST